MRTLWLSSPIICAVLFLGCSSSGDARLEASYVQAMESELKRLATAQEIYYGDNIAYTTTLPSTIYTVTDGVTGPTITLTADGWAGWVGHQLMSKTCAIFIGTTGLAPATNEGSPKCTP